MRVLVIGSHGFIASYVIFELHARGYHVVGLQRHLDRRSNLMDPDIYPDEVIVGDIKDAECVSRAVSQCEYVINLAGRLGTSEEVNNPYPAVEVNIIGTLNVLDACRTWKREFLQIAVGNHWMNNTYSITRTTAERFTLMYAKEHGVKANVVRALNAYGPRQSYFSYKKIIPSFVLNALQDKPLKITGDGKQVMDMIFVADLAAFLVGVLVDAEAVNKHMNEIRNEGIYGKWANSMNEFGKEIYGNIYQCGEGEALTVTEIAEMVIRLCESKSKIEYVPMRAGEPMNAKVISDYKSPSYSVTLEEGLKKTIEYYRANLDLYTK